MFAADSGVRPDSLRAQALPLDIVRARSFAQARALGLLSSIREAFSPVIGFAVWTNSQGYRQVVSVEVHHLRIGARVKGRPDLGISRATEIVGKW